MAHNEVYRRLRTRALAIGCTFTEAWPRYLLLPFNELEVIVTNKRVPYVPSGRLLREMETQCPGVFTVDEMRMPESYHLHEAAHVVAEDLCRGLKLNTREEQILKIILCESFANTVDALACVPATDDLHQFFIAQNCYMKPRKNAMDAMSRLIKRLGFRFTFMLTLSSYLHANFLREPPTPETIADLLARYATTTTLTAQLEKDCGTIGRLGEKLDPLFRVQTTSMYFKMIGFTDDIEDLLDFSFLDTLARHPEMIRATEAMCDVVAGA